MVTGKEEAEKSMVEGGTHPPDISFRIFGFRKYLFVIGLIVGVANLALLSADSEGTYPKAFLKAEIEGQTYKHLFCSV